MPIDPNVHVRAEKGRLSNCPIIICELRKMHLVLSTKDHVTVNAAS